MVPAFAFGQSGADSLWGVWNNQELPDSSRFDAMVGLIRGEYLYNYPDSGYHYAQVLYDAASLTDEKEYLGAAKLFQGISYYLKNDLETAIEYYTESLDLFTEYDETNGIASALGNLAMMNEKLGRLDTAVAYYSKCMELFDSIENMKGVAGVLNNMGQIEYRQGNIQVALDYYNRSMEIKKEIGDLTGAATTSNNIGSILNYYGDIAGATRYYYDALEISESIEDWRGVSRSLDHIGTLYLGQSDFERALEYYNQSYSIADSVQDKGAMAVALNNKATVYVNLGDMDQAIQLHKESLQLYVEAGIVYSIAHTYGNIASVYQKIGELDSAMYYNEQSLEIRREINDVPGIASSLSNIGAIYEEQGQLQKAIALTEEGLELAQEVGDLVTIQTCAMNLSNYYETIGNYERAFFNYNIYIEMRDSLASEENQDEIIRQEYKYQYTKQSLADSLGFVQQQQLDEMAHEAEIEEEAQKRYMLYGGLGFVVLLGGMAFRGYQRKKKDNVLISEQKAEVEHQKEIVEEQKQEIVDSITYAKRIQEAILPPDRLVKEYLSNSFVLYKPKDIVAGDFYWMESADGMTIFAAADCTGHGVPGAMVSVVCHNAMNRSVREFGLREPGKILDKTRELVVTTFEKSEEDVKDGMDVALCALKGNTLMYAGANNPLWIIREGEVLETKATKQAVGLVDEPKPFETHTFELLPGDTFYTFSDGFVDQFGGEKGKKFKARAFKELLISIQPEPLERQRDLIDQAFEAWRGDLEQVDDVCVIGVRI